MRSTIFRIAYFSVFFSAVLLSHCDERTSQFTKELSLSTPQNMKHLQILEVAKNLNMLMDASVKDSNPYVSSPTTSPNYDSLSPIPLPENNSPPYCVNPPTNPQSPSSIITGPVVYSPTPPTLGGSTPSPIILTPVPTSPYFEPSPVVYNPTPYYSSPPPILGGSTPGPFYEPSPPGGSIPSPYGNIPSPIGFAPSPPVFEPPVVYPPPAVPPPSSSAGSHGTGVWCVAKPSVPDPIIQEAMNYACGSGADCDPIQPTGQCYMPNTLLAHASFAFNSYWQRTKVAGGTCSFGGTAILVTVDPNTTGCIIRYSRLYPAIQHNSFEVPAVFYVQKIQQKLQMSSAISQDTIGCI